jgi:hypothetical protein
MPNWKKVIVSGSAANLSSLNVDTYISASSISAIEFTGSLFGTASQALSSSYSLYALTASYALNAASTPGVGSSVLYTQATAATTWVFQHNLGGTYVTTDVYDSSDNIIIPQNITATDANTLTITFSTPTSGHAVATVGGGLPAISASFANYTLQVNNEGTAAAWQPAVSASFAVSASYATTASYASTVGFNFEQITPSTTWTINHNLNNQHPLVQIYDSSHLIFIPQSISGSSANTVIVTFSTAVTGYARVV